MAKGLIKGLGITIKRFFQPKVTVQYPEERLPLPDRFFGRPEFYYDKCIACNMCVNACPNQVIKLVTETVEKKKVVIGYDFDLQYCLFCGFCQEACPKDAIKFTKDFELTCYRRSAAKLAFVQPDMAERKKAEIKQAAAKAAAEAAKALAATAQAADKEGS
ncbi:NuoI/complex I 23 kDa subunit family protein [Desulforamulus hydrothermalis]|uniref:NADH-quinone oxidoreductase subunit I n=1 Tax=Desulforamulus hydrothermalis Lam5 = DSM 18033 TaxID=1121428 RepID=K8DZM8_9FIRM|nr:NADH-quinone oxidoreductase subunit I [Desulforamulus hydrothermalis]CCO08465.1 NADH-quinone oxidoreductase subunit I [Desulforamulus hydrothermalis Lam5 = DSM 18033]SHH29010.1 NADH dehydrogenase subunit I [Desulforamulus hydrothermalis Lam5 = DSM 18033]